MFRGLLSSGHTAFLRPRNLRVIADRWFSHASESPPTSLAPEPPEDPDRSLSDGENQSEVALASTDPSDLSKTDQELDLGLSVPPEFPDMPFNEALTGFKRTLDWEYSGENTFTLFKAEYQLDYESFFGGERFTHLDFFVRYVHLRHPHMQEHEYTCLVQVALARAWVDALHADHPDTLLLLIGVFTRLRFVDIPLFVDSVRATRDLGLLSSEKPVVNFLFNLNRLFFFDLPKRNRQRNFSESNLYLHNRRRQVFLTARLDSTPTHSLDDLVAALQTVLVPAPADPVFKDLVAFYDFRREYLPFDRSYFLAASQSSPDFISTLLSLTDLFYELFWVHPSLRQAHLANEEIYNNFELSIGESFRLFSLTQLNAYLDLFFHRVVLLEERLASAGQDPGFVSTLLRTMKIDYIDAIFAENAQSLSPIELARFVYVLGKVRFGGSLVVGRLFDIFLRNKIDFTRNLQSLVLTVTGVGMLAGVDPKVFFHLERDFVGGFLRDPNFWNTFDRLTMIRMLVIFAKAFSSRILWRLVGPRELGLIRPDFLDTLWILAERERFQLLTEDELEFLDGFSGIQSFDPWLYKLPVDRLPSLLPLFVRFLHFLRARDTSGDQSDFASRLSDFLTHFLKFVDLNMSEINALPVLLRRDYFLFYTLLFAFLPSPPPDQAASTQTLPQRRHSDAPLSPAAQLHSAFHFYRSIVNVICRHVEDIDTNVFMDLYLAMGSLCRVHPEVDHDFQFWRRKLFHYIADRLQTEGPNNTLEILRKAVFTGYSFDLLFQEILEVNFLGALDGLDLPEKIEVLVLHSALYLRTKAEGLASLSSKAEFFGAVAASCLEAASKVDTSFQGLDGRYWTALEQQVVWMTTEFKMDDRLVKALEDFKQQNQFFLGYVAEEGKKEITVSQTDQELRDDDDIRFLTTTRLFQVAQEITDTLAQPAQRGGRPGKTGRPSGYLTKEFGFDMDYFRQLWRQRRQLEVAGSAVAVRRETN